MTIPTYKANVGQYNVPSMNNSGEQANNNLIFEGLARFNSSITKAAVSMYEMEKEEEAKKAGAEAGSQKDFDPSTLPTAATKAQKAYNDAAIKHYANTFNLETSKAIEQLAFENDDNAAKFLTDTDSYLQGVSKNMPAHLKDTILYPLQVKAQAEYSTILRRQASKQEKFINEQTYYNLKTSARKFANMDFSTNDQKVLDQNNMAFAGYEEYVKSQVGVTITAEQGIAFMNEAVKGAAYSIVYNTFKDKDLSEEGASEFIDNFIHGESDNKYLKMLSPQEKSELLNYSFDQIGRLDNEERRVRAIKEEKASLAIDTMKTRFLDEVYQNPENAREIMHKYRNDTYKLGITTQQKKDIMSFFADDQVKTSAYAKADLDAKAANGELTLNDLTYYRSSSELSFQDFVTYSQSMKKPLALNKKTDAWSFIQQDINARYSTRNDMGFVEPNEKGVYINRRMTSFMMNKLHSEDELMEEYRRATDDAKSVDKGNEMPIPISIGEIMRGVKLPTYSAQELKNLHSIKVKQKNGTKEIDVEKFMRPRLRKTIIENNPALTEEEADKVFNKLLSILNQNFGGKL